MLVGSLTNNQNVFTLTNHRKRNRTTSQSELEAMTPGAEKHVCAISLVWLWLVEKRSKAFSYSQSHCVGRQNDITFDKILLTKTEIENWQQGWGSLLPEGRFFDIFFFIFISRSLYLKTDRFRILIVANWKRETKTSGHHVTTISAHFSFTFCPAYVNISRIALTTKRKIILRAFYIQISFFSEEMETRTQRLPFAVNVNLTLYNRAIFNWVS